MRLKKFVSPQLPINASPVSLNMKNVELAAKIGKYIPHPTVQAVAHTVDKGVKIVKEAKKIKSAVMKQKKGNDVQKKSSKRENKMNRNFKNNDFSIDDIGYE